MTKQLTPVKVEKLVPKKRHGLIVVITGNGKGKTTSAMGMVLRASGYGMKVCIIQFMKGDLYSGEWDGVKLLGDRVGAQRIREGRGQGSANAIGSTSGAASPDFGTGGWQIDSR